MIAQTEEFNGTDTVGSIVVKHPALSRIFEDVGIDYCCGGKLPLQKACAAKGVKLDVILGQLHDALSAPTAPQTDVASMTLTELADHIEGTHHSYLITEMPRLLTLTGKVAKVHGDKDHRLGEIHDVVTVLFGDMTQHMMKEERILFPMIRELDSAATVNPSHCGTVANPIRQMEYEHDEAGSALERLRELTEDYTVPDWACNTYRAMLDGLLHFEKDLHQHVHKENNVLFPRAIAREAERAGA